MLCLARRGKRVASEGSSEVDLESRTNGTHLEHSTARGLDIDSRQRKQIPKGKTITKDVAGDGCISQWPKNNGAACDRPLSRLHHESYK